ncbi:MAG: hypothetical protein F9K38_15305 [Pseudorhodoplanes sp.]|nr:MAG: hypothetical protein F9K38_15305 [Pseudorhodoplanes sp.]
MTERQHRFRIGQMVEILPTTLRAAANGTYEIVRLVPCDSRVPTYRLKSKNEKFERVLAEHELIALPDIAS